MHYPAAHAARLAFYCLSARVLLPLSLHCCLVTFPFRLRHVLDDLGQYRVRRDIFRLCLEVKRIPWRTAGKYARRTSSKLTLKRPFNNACTLDARVNAWTPRGGAATNVAIGDL